jgi:hypothetical protein
MRRLIRTSLVCGALLAQAATVNGHLLHHLVEQVAAHAACPEHCSQDQTTAEHEDTHEHEAPTGEHSCQSCFVCSVNEDVLAVRLRPAGTFATCEVSSSERVLTVGSAECLAVAGTIALGAPPERLHAITLPLQD